MGSCERQLLTATAWAAELARVCTEFDPSPGCHVASCQPRILSQLGPEVATHVEAVLLGDAGISGSYLSDSEASWD